MQQSFVYSLGDNRGVGNVDRYHGFLCGNIENDLGCVCYRKKEQEFKKFINYERLTDLRSHMMLYSATGERFPIPTAPPMKTNSSTASSKSGYTLAKSAIFVIGPLDITVTWLPEPFFHAFLMFVDIPSNARTREPSLSRANKESNRGSSTSGRPSTPPSPSSPCISGSCFAGSRRGCGAPG